MPQTVKEQKLPVKVDNENGDDLKESFQDQINIDAAQLHTNWVGVSVSNKSVNMVPRENVHHPASPYLEYLRDQGAPVKFSTAP